MVMVLVIVWVWSWNAPYNDLRMMLESCARNSTKRGGKGGKGRFAFVGFDSWSVFFLDFRCDLDLLISHIFYLMRNELFCGTPFNKKTQSLEIHVTKSSSSWLKTKLGPKKMQG